MKILHTLTLCGSLAAVGMQAQAATIVDLDFGTTSFDSSTTDSPRSEPGGDEITFDTSDPFFTSTEYATTPTSGTFYGGVGLSTDGGSNDVTIAQGKDGTPDFVQFGRGFGLPSGTIDFTVAVLWKKADFLNGGDSQSVDLTTDNALSLDWTDRSNNASLTGRWLVDIDGTTYVSNESFSGGAVTSSAITSTTWASIDLADSMFNAPGSFGALSVSDIDGVGFYLSGNYSGGGLELAQLNSYSADAAVIPEPSSFALLAGALGMGLVMMRRRRS